MGRWPGGEGSQKTCLGRVPRPSWTGSGAILRIKREIPGSDFFGPGIFFAGPRALKGKDQPHNLNRKGVDG